MKIFKTPIAYEIGCTRCGAILHFSLDETMDMDSTYSAKYIKCPVCGESLITHTRDMTRAVLHYKVQTIYAEDCDCAVMQVKGA